MVFLWFSLWLFHLFHLPLKPIIFCVGPGVRGDFFGHLCHACRVAWAHGGYGCGPTYYKGGPVYDSEGGAVYDNHRKMVI